MKNKLLSVLLVLFCVTGFSQLEGIYVETHPLSGTIGTTNFDGFSSYRIYAQTTNPTDRLLTVIGSQTCPLDISTSTNFYKNSFAGSNTSGSISEFFLTFVPELEYSSFVTIGNVTDASVGIPRIEDPTGRVPLAGGSTTIINGSSDPLDIWEPTFSAGGNISISGFNGSSWFALPGSANSLGTGVNNSVCIGQFTTDGDFSFNINVGIFPENQGEIPYTNCATPGLGLTYPILDIEGCTDEIACNYDPFATLENDSCLEDDNCGVCGGDDSSCTGCTELTACNYDSQNTIPAPETCDFVTCYGCTNPDACNYVDTATIEDDSCVVLNAGFISLSGATNTYCVGDGVPDELTVGSGFSEGPNHLYILTSSDGTVILSQESNLINFEPLQAGVCLITRYTFDNDADLTGLNTSSFTGCFEQTAPISITKNQGGCSDSEATNFQTGVTCNNDQSSCTYGIPGCTNTTACNYDSTATTDDGTCELPDGCTSATACNYDLNALCDNGSCNEPDGCTDSTACNYDSSASCDDNSCTFSPCNPGCTDPCADNYDSTADEDDNSCNPYDTTCNQDCLLGDIQIWDPTTCACITDSTPIIGCTNSFACNYDPTADCDDGSCNEPDGCTSVSACNYDLNALCDDGSCNEPDGCTSDTACNYDLTALCDDGSCNEPDGCTSATACNYDLTALCDNGSCNEPDGCTSATACNYDLTALCDDGSCEFILDGFCDCDGNILDCNGDCNGSATEDECGVCNGDNSSCADCCGVVNGDGTTCDGDCGSCGDSTSCLDDCGVPNGDNSSCSGCTVSTACNYDVTATIDDGSCLENDECDNCDVNNNVLCTFSYTTDNFPPNLNISNGEVLCITSDVTATVGSINVFAGGMIKISDNSTFTVQGALNVVPNGRINLEGCNSDIFIDGNYSGGSFNDCDIYRYCEECSNESINSGAPVDLGYFRTTAAASWVDVCCCDGFETVGCTDSEACNFDSTAAVDDGSCLDNDVCGDCGGSGIDGCTDDTACNFDPNATCDLDQACQTLDACGDCGGDNSCVIVQCYYSNCDNSETVCLGGSNTIYLANASVTMPDEYSGDVSVNLSGAPAGMTFNDIQSYDIGPDFPDDFNHLYVSVDDTFVPGTYTFDIVFTRTDGITGSMEVTHTTTVPTVMCSDFDACNFSYEAINCSDNSDCVYPDACEDCGGDGTNGCMDDTACNYNPNATCDLDDACLQLDACEDCGGDGTNGCMDDTACNYNSNATCDLDQACTFSPCNPGCTDPCASNYDSTADGDDNSCQPYDITCPENTCFSIYEWSPDICGCQEIAVDYFCDDENDCTVDYLDEETCECVNELIDGCGDVLGCTNVNACNYDDLANVNDDSCILPDGCTNFTANNYDPNALCDDGSCEFCMLTIECNNGSNYQCIDDIPAGDAGDIVIIDSCGNPSITWTETNTGTGCVSDPYMLTRTFTIVDESGTATCDIEYTAADTEAPEMTLPDDISAEITCAEYTCGIEAGFAFVNGLLTDEQAAAFIGCNEELFSLLNIVPTNVTDNCDDDVQYVASNLVPIVHDGCVDYEGSTNVRYSIICYFSATDDCGNEAEEVFTILNIVDNTAPVTPEAPEEENVQCASEVSAPVDLTALDDCQGPITVSPSEVITPGECDNQFTMVRTWTFIDACGNESSVSQTINVIDETAPVLSGLPDSELTINCQDEHPELPLITADDNCDSNVLVEFTEVYNGFQPDPEAYENCEGIQPLNASADWSMALFGLPGHEDEQAYYNTIFSQVSFYDDNGNGLEALLTGTVYDQSNPNGGWHMYIPLTAGMGWDAWSAIEGNSYKDDFNLAGDAYLDWTYYLVNSEGAYVEGWGDLEGSYLDISHTPIDNSIGWQHGVGANNVGPHFGLGGWMAFDGFYQNTSLDISEDVQGAGDVAVDLNCCPTYLFTRIWTAIDCVGNESSFSQEITVLGTDAQAALFCFADFNFDGNRTTNDLAILLTDYGCYTGECGCDLTGDGFTSSADLGIFLALYGVPCENADSED